MAKITKVTLTSPAGVAEFEFSHAERLLSMKKNGGWRLPDDSKYIFEDNAIKPRTDKKADNGGGE